MAGFQRILVICPPHLVPKWKREVEQTVPGVRAAIVESITDLERLRLSTGPGPLFAVMSREKAKLSYRWEAAVIQRWAVSSGTEGRPARLIRDEETGEPFACAPRNRAPRSSAGKGIQGNSFNDAPVRSETRCKTALAFPGTICKGLFCYPAYAIPCIGKLAFCLPDNLSHQMSLRVNYIAKLLSKYPESSHSVLVRSL